jgi:hypothetical protein
LLCKSTMGGASQNTFHSLTIAQNDAVRAMLGKPRYTSVTPLYNTNKILRLESLYTREILVYMYNQTYYNTSDNIYVGQTNRTERPNTRNINKPIINRDRLEVRRRGPINQMLIKWELLPAKFKTHQKTKLFRKGLITYLLNQKNTLE